MTITRVRPLSVGKIAGLLYALIGLCLGAFISLFALVGGMAAGLARDSEGGPGAAIGMLFGVGAIVIFPIVYGLMGFVMSIIMAFIYNLVAGVVGGIQVDVT
jgi:hypothetical protein